MPLNAKIQKDIDSGKFIKPVNNTNKSYSAKDLSSSGIIGGANVMSRNLESTVAQNMSDLLTNDRNGWLREVFYNSPYAIENKWNPQIDVAPNIPITNNYSSNNNIDLTGIYDGVANAMTGLTDTLSDMYGKYVQAQQSAAAYANEQSKIAQERQFEMNKELMKMSGDYQTQSAKTANDFTRDLFNQAMNYNSNEALKNRTWQENMSNTAYQRAMADMKKAGLNPILAYQNGGATVGSGATASIGQSTGQSAGSISGSVGNYSGQGYHIDDKFAAIGALIGTVGNLLSAYKVGQKGDLVKSKIVEPVEKILEGAIDTAHSTANWFLTHNMGWNIGQWIYKKKNSTGGGGGHGF